MSIQSGPCFLILDNLPNTGIQTGDGSKHDSSKGRRMNQKRRVLFLCTGNSCRSQMAEGWSRHLKGDVIQAFSAGVETHGLNPHAVTVMAESGVDISNQASKHVREFVNTDLDAVITVCDHARESCPYFPTRARMVHVGFDDPPALAREVAEKGGDAAAQMDCYRRVRDEIRDFVKALPDNVFPEDHP